MIIQLIQTSDVDNPNESTVIQNVDDNDQFSTNYSRAKPYPG